MKFVKSGFVSGGFCPTLGGYDSLQNKTRIPETAG